MSKFYKEYQKYKLFYLKSKSDDTTVFVDSINSFSYDSPYDVEDMNYFSDNIISVRPREVPFSIASASGEEVNIYNTKNDPNIIIDSDQVIDIGLVARARGKIVSKETIDPEEYISFEDESNKEKILYIKDDDSFDNFTEKYGYFDKKNHNKLIIKWDNVANDYKGFCLDHGMFGDRSADVYYKGHSVTSWVNNEFLDIMQIDGVILFEPIPKIDFGEAITKPFRGKKYSENDFPEDNYVGFHETPNREKILRMTNTEDFDEFTNKYGLVSNENDIIIKWDNVKRDMKGFYIDKDSELEDLRYKRAFHNGKKYDSWWLKYKIKFGIVYVFE